MGKIIDFLNEHPNLKFWIAMFIIFSIACLIINNRIAQLYKVQAEIVIHDYGHVFETIEDWKLERIEKYNIKDIKKDETEIKTY